MDDMLIFSICGRHFSSMPLRFLSVSLLAATIAADAAATPFPIVYFRLISFADFPLISRRSS
jgi:hypothetical protein